MTLYRDATVDEIEQGYLEPTYVVPVEPTLYVYQQGGLSNAFYPCSQDEADAALFDIRAEGEQL